MDFKHFYRNVNNCDDFSFFIYAVDLIENDGRNSIFALVFIPDQWMFSNYAEAMKMGNWPRYFFNSFFVTVLAVIISLLFNSFAGYSFARLKFRGRDVLFFIALIGMMIPPQVTMLPVFLILKGIPLAGGNDIFGQGGLGWIDSYPGLLAPDIAGAFGVFLFRQFFMNFPRELDEASKVDGLNSVGIFLRIYAPLSGPIIATLIALKSAHVWNEFTWPLIITRSDEMKTVQLGLTLFADEFTIQWNLLMAATTLIILPLLIVFLLLQRYFVQGIVTTGVKG